MFPHTFSAIRKYIIKNVFQSKLHPGLFGTTYEDFDIYVCNKAYLKTALMSLTTVSVLSYPGTSEALCSGEARTLKDASTLTDGACSKLYFMISPGIKEGSPSVSKTK